MILTTEELAQRFGYLHSPEVEFLKRLPKLLDVNPVIVNIGAGAGTSALALWEGRPDALAIYTVDKTKHSSPLGCLIGEQNALVEAELWGKVNHIQIHGNSSEVGLNWDKGNVDMVFVDGDHSLEGCSRDIFAWLPVLLQNDSRKKILAFHDYHGGVWQDVVDAVDEIVIKKYKLKIIEHVDTTVAFWVR